MVSADLVVRQDLTRGGTMLRGAVLAPNTSDGMDQHCLHVPAEVDEALRLAAPVGMEEQRQLPLDLPLLDVVHKAAGATGWSARQRGHLASGTLADCDFLLGTGASTTLTLIHPGRRTCERKKRCLLGKPHHHWQAELTIL